MSTYQGSISLAKVKDGEGGTPGTNTATVYLYQRATSAPQKPDRQLTYTFSTGVVSGSALGNWKQNIAELTGTNPIYFILAVASSTGATDTIESGDWKGPSVLAQNGQDGQAGRGVYSVVMKFINWATNTEAQKPTTSTSGWSENVPTYNSSKPYYYVWVRTNYNDNSTPTDEIYLDNGLSDANRTAATANSISQAAEENAQGALSIAQGVRQYFWFQGSDYSASIPAGTYITQIPEASFKNNLNNQPNLLLRSSSINLRYGEDTHAQLTSTGLNVLKGGVQGGTIGQPNGIYLSTEDYGSTVTISEHQASDWREIIGTNFGVRADGTMHASNGYFNGHLEASSGYISNSVTIGSNGTPLSKVESNAAIALNDSVEYIVGTHGETATNVWTGVTRDDSLNIGKTIAFYLTSNGTDNNAILELTFANGGTSGPREIRINNSNVTTHFTQGTVILLTYDGTYWKCEDYGSRYITRIDRSGIVIHSENDAVSNIEVNANGVEIKRNGTSVAKYGAETRIGEESGFHIKMGANAEGGRLSFYQGKDNEVAYITNNQLYITQSVVLQQMDVGTPLIDNLGGQWSWKVHANTNGQNNLYLKWIG